MTSILTFLLSLFTVFDVPRIELHPDATISGSILQLLNALVKGIGVKMEAQQERIVDLEDTRTSLYGELEEAASKRESQEKYWRNVTQQYRNRAENLTGDVAKLQARLVILLTSGKMSIGDLVTYQFQSDIDVHIRANRKIEAIKLLRSETGLGLKEAKDVIDARACENDKIPF